MAIPSRSTFCFAGLFEGYAVYLYRRASLCAGPVLRDDEGSLHLADFTTAVMLRCAQHDKFNTFFNKLLSDCCKF